MRSGTFKLLSGAALAASAMLVAQSAAAFSFNGYFRSGAGVNSEGGKLICYKAPGAQEYFRLGNECLTVYSELVFSDVVYEKGGTSAGLHSRVAFIADNASNEGDSTTGLGLPEMWAYIENPFGGGATFWAGKRFYRYGIHINDSFYWNQSGTGGGFTGLDIGFANLSYATIFNANQPLKDDFFNPNPNDPDQSAIKQVFQLKGIQLNPGGQLQFAFTYTFTNNEGNDSGPDADGNNGWAVLVQHTQTDFLMDGSTNRLIFQYGQAAGAELDVGANPNYDSDIATFRIVDALVANITRDFSMSLVGKYQHTNNADETATLVEDLISAGGRFVYYLTDNFRLNLEVSSTWTQGGTLSNGTLGNTNDTARLTKITFAPALTVDRGFFARPELRLFVTYADWNGTSGDLGVIRNANVDSPFSGTSGWTAGIQAEIWW